MAKQYTQEELQHFVDHPEEVDGTNTDLVEALSGIERTILGVSEADLVKEPKAEDPDAEAAKKAAAEAQAKIDAEVKAEEEAKAKAQADADAKARAGSDKGEGVATKDGKGVIPFAVLDGERKGRAAAERALAEAQQTILTLSERVKARQAGKEDPGAGKDEKTADELQTMLDSIVDEDAPWLEKLQPMVDAVRAAQAELAALKAEREAEERERQETEEEARQRLQQEADDAIAANPVLSHWQEHAPHLFKEAASFDNALRAQMRDDPAQADRFPTFSKRFERVVDLVKASHAGETIPMPAHVPATTKPATQQPSAADIKARADEALQKAGAASITTLSDIPGGVGEVGTEEALTRMDVTQIADKFARMSTQEVINWVMTH